MSDPQSHSVAFVRTETIPESPPPASEAGLYKWARENLFNGWVNSLMTVAGLYIIYTILVSAMPWILNGIWNTDSLAECREALEGKVGACFSVLSERWNQLLFGFKYPVDQYWRPGLAFVLLFLAAAPVMFFKLPRKLLIFTAIYPFLAYWLIWGGTILSPLVAMLGFVVGYLAYSKLVNRSFAAGFFGGVAAAFVTWWLGGMIVDAMRPRIRSCGPCHRATWGALCST